MFLRPMLTPHNRTCLVYSKRFGMAFQYSSNEATLASEATEFFGQSQFGSCFSHMKKLYSTKSTDPKVYILIKNN